MNTHFFLEKGQSTSQNSKVKQAVNDYFRSLSGTLIHAADFPEVQKLIKQKVDEINQEFPRCKPVKISIEYVSSSKNYYVSGIDGMYFTFKPAELSEPSTVTQYSISNN